MTGESYAIRLYEPELADACDRFTRRVWPRRDDGDETGRSRDAAAPAPRVLFLKGGEVIGHVATVPVRLAVAGRLLDASWAVGLMVVPEHRSGPVAPLMLKKLNESIDIGLTLHVDDTALRVFKGVRWQHLGVVPQYVRILDALACVRTLTPRAQQFLPRPWSRLGAVLPRVSRPVAVLISAAITGLSAVGALRRRGAAAVTVAEERTFDAGYTELAERVRDKFTVWVFRDEQYLTSRYGSRMASYRLLACRRQGRLLGYCIIKLRQFDSDPRLGNLRMGTIVDCLFDPDEPEVLDALVRSAIALCRRAGSDVVFCSASFGAIGRRLRRHGFLRIAGTLNAAFHDRSHMIDTTIPLAAWHLMRGDSDADASC